MKDKSERRLNQTARITFDTIRGLGIEVWQASDEDLKPYDNGRKGDWIVRVIGQNVLNRDDLGDSISVRRNHLYRWPNRVPTKKQLARACRNVLREHFEHEIEEGLFVDGERVFDPHKDE